MKERQPVGSRPERRQQLPVELQANGSSTTPSRKLMSGPVQDLAAKLAQLNGPLQDCVSAAMREASSIIESLTAIQNKYAGQAQAARLSNPTSNATLAPEPYVTISALARAKEQVHEVVHSYLSSLLSGQQDFVASHQQSSAQQCQEQARALDVEAEEVEREVAEVREEKSNTASALEFLREKIDAATSHLDTGRRDIQKSIQQHQAQIAVLHAEITRLTAQVTAHEDAVLAAREQLTTEETQTSVALERYMAIQQRLMEEQAEMAHREVRVDKRVQALAARRAAIDEQQQQGNRTTVALLQTTKRLADSVKQVQQMHMEAKALACSQLNQAMRTATKHSKLLNNAKFPTPTPQRLAQALTSLQLDAIACPDSTTLLPSCMKDKALKVQQALTLAKQCGMDQDTVMAAIQPDWITKAALGMETIPAIPVLSMAAPQLGRAVTLPAPKDMSAVPSVLPSPQAATLAHAQSDVTAATHTLATKASAAIATADAVATTTVAAAANPAEAAGPAVPVVPTPQPEPIPVAFKAVSAAPRVVRAVTLPLPPTAAGPPAPRAAMTATAVALGHAPGPASAPQQAPKKCSPIQESTSPKKTTVKSAIRTFTRLFVRPLGAAKASASQRPIQATTTITTTISTAVVSPRAVNQPHRAAPAYQRRFRPTTPITPTVITNRRGAVAAAINASQARLAGQLINQQAVEAQLRQNRTQARVRLAADTSWSQAQEQCKKGKGTQPVDVCHAGIPSVSDVGYPQRVKKQLAVEEVNLDYDDDDFNMPTPPPAWVQQGVAHRS